MSYSGQIVTIPLGVRGLITDTADIAQAPGSLIRADNVTLDGIRVIKAAGSRRLTASPLDGAIMALHDWMPNSVRQRTIALTHTGSIYRDIGNFDFNGQIPIKTGLATPDNQALFVDGGLEEGGNPKKLFLFTGSNQIQVLTDDGTTFADINKPAAEWTKYFPTFGIQHNLRLWAFGSDAAPHRVIASSPFDHEDFQTPADILTFEIFPGEGERLIGAIVYGGRLYLFKKPFGIYFIDDSDTNSANWKAAKLQASSGIASAHSMLYILNDILYKNETGSITSLAATQKFGDLESADMLNNLQNEGFMRKETNTRGNQFSHALWYPDKKRALFTYQSRTSANENDLLMVMDFQQEQARVSWERKDKINCMALRYFKQFGKQKPIYGTNAGHIFEYDVDLREVDGAGYSMVLETPDMDLGAFNQELSGKHKLFDFLELVFEPEGRWNVTCEVFIDSHLVRTLLFKQHLEDGLAGPTPSTTDFILDANEINQFQDLLAGHNPRYLRKKIGSSGRRIKLRLTLDGAGTRATLLSAILSVRVSDEKSRRRQV